MSGNEGFGGHVSERLAGQPRLLATFVRLQADSTDFSSGPGTMRARGETGTAGTSQVPASVIQLVRVPKAYLPYGGQVPGFRSRNPARKI